MTKILIAEDNPVNRELLRELLEMRGHEVFEACDGLQALAMIDEVRPDLLILDLGMPGLDGFAVIRRIRADATHAKLPVLAATAYAMRGDRERVLEAGFDGYISKPINPAALKDEMNRLLDTSESRKASSASAKAGSS
jgi:two-component system, cell cycle response regulator DivK